eukprot:3536647-Rhodomonas_salina.1
MESAPGRRTRCLCLSLSCLCISLSIAISNEDSSAAAVFKMSGADLESVVPGHEEGLQVVRSSHVGPQVKVEWVKEDHHRGSSAVERKPLKT